MRVGIAIGFFILGSAALGAISATSSRVVPTAAIALVECLFIGVGSWLPQRRTVERRLSELNLTSAPTVDRRRRALARGVLMSVAAAAAAGFALGLVAWALGGDHAFPSTVAGLLLGIAFSHALSARDLEHWQLVNKRLLFTNGTRYRFAFTAQQALDQIVLVAVTDDAGDRAGIPG